MAGLGLHCPAGFALVAEQDLLSSCGARPSHCGAFSCCRSTGAQ